MEREIEIVLLEIVVLVEAVIKNIGHPVPSKYCIYHFPELFSIMIDLQEENNFRSR